MFVSNLMSFYCPFWKFVCIGALLLYLYLFITSLTVQYLMFSRGGPWGRGLWYRPFWLHVCTFILSYIIFSSLRLVIKLFAFHTSEMAGTFTNLLWVVLHWSSLLTWSKERCRMVCLTVVLEILQRLICVQQHIGRWHVIWKYHLYVVLNFYW